MENYCSCTAFTNINQLGHCAFRFLDKTGNGPEHAQKAGFLCVGAVCAGEEARLHSNICSEKRSAFVCAMPMSSREMAFLSQACA